MWCAACRADVAAELSPDNRRMLCARCHAELGTAAGALDRPLTEPRLQDTERNARELLARWSTQHLLESPIAAGPAAEAVSLPESLSAVPRPTLPVSPPVRRFDQAHPGTPVPAVAAAQKSPAETNPPVPERRRRRKVARPQLAEVTRDEPITRRPEPFSHDDLVRKAVQQPTVRQGNWTTTIGQLCAYGGVAVLTLGTVMVLSGYFGGPTNYAPTGWLVAAVGQMLLFLGVVTLVSGGMEQTVDEVAWRIDHLTTQIMQLEKTIESQQALLETKHRDRPPRSSREDRADAA